MKNNGNKIVLCVASALLILGLSVGYGYSQKYSNIDVDKQEMNNLTVAYVTSEICFKLGAASRTKDNDLSDIIYRIKYNDLTNPPLVKNGKLIKTELEKTINERVNMTIEESNNNPVMFIQAKELCSVLADKAANLKSNFK